MNSKNQLTQYTHKWAVSLLVTSIVVAVFWLYDPVVVKDMGYIQFSSTLNDFNKYVFQQLDQITLNTYLDFAFILTYTVLFYLAYRVFQSTMRIRVSKFWILLCLVPGLFDIIENILLLYLINDLDNGLLFEFFWVVVRAKWTLIIPFVLINVTIFIYYLLKILSLFFN